MIIAISRIEITQGMAKEKKFAAGSTKDTVHSGCHADMTTDVRCLNVESTVMEQHQCRNRNQNQNGQESVKLTDRDRAEEPSQETMKINFVLYNCYVLINFRVAIFY